MLHVDGATIFFVVFMFVLVVPQLVICHKVTRRPEQSFRDWLNS